MVSVILRVHNAIFCQRFMPGPSDQIPYTGIWDVYSNQQVVDRVRRLLAQRKTLQEVCESMIDLSIAPDCEWGGVGCDNMTFMIVALFGNKTKSEWYDMICERLERGEGYPTPATFQNPFAPGSKPPTISHTLALAKDEPASPPSYEASADKDASLEESCEPSASAPDSVGASLLLGRLLSNPSPIIQALWRVGNAVESPQDPPALDSQIFHPGTIFSDLEEDPPSVNSAPVPAPPPTSTSTDEPTNADPEPMVAEE